MKWKIYFWCSVPYRQLTWGRSEVPVMHWNVHVADIGSWKSLYFSRSFEGTSLWSRTTVITAGLSLLSLYFQAHHWSLRTTGGTYWGLGLHHDSAQLSGPHGPVWKATAAAIQWLMQTKWWPFRCSVNNRDDDQDSTTLLLAEQAEGRKYSDLSPFYLTYLRTIAMQGSCFDFHSFLQC